MSFRRQHPVLGFIADFYAPSRRLVIEVDGGVHETSTDYDEERTRILNSAGVRVLRVTNTQVETAIDQVCAEIARLLNE